jgi:hypothetical protein
MNNNSKMIEEKGDGTEGGWDEEDGKGKLEEIIKQRGKGGIKRKVETKLREERRR